MKTVLLLFAAAFLGLPTCASAVDFVREDAAVLTAAMQKRCADIAKNPGDQFILSTDASVVDAVSVPNSVDAVAAQLLRERNRSTHPLPKIALCPAYRFATQKQMSNALAHHGWSGFHRAFPDTVGITYLSLPGYSADGTLAVAQVSVACGGFCGAGLLWIFRKIDGKWIFIRSLPAWIS